MKKISVLILLLFSFALVKAQISVRVKNSGSTKEVDIKTSGKPGTTSKTNTKPAAETKTTPAAETKTVSTDTTAKPSGATGFDESYKGPARVQLKAFWRSLEKLRAGDMPSLNNAERMLGMIKENDPSYDVSAMEAEVKSYREKSNKEQKAQSDAAAKANEENSYYDEVWRKLIGVYSKGSDIEPGVTGKTYYDRVQEVNLPEYLSKKNTASTDEAKRFVQKLDEMLADYDNYVKRADRLKWNVTEIMVKARNEANPQKKTQMLEEARYECEAVLIMSPANASFKQKLDEVNKLMGNANAEAAKNYTSDFHKEHVGQIVWSTKPLIIGKEKDMSADIKNEFKSGDAIFGTVYLGNQAKQLMDGNERLRVIIKVDGGTAVWGGDLSYFIIPLSVQDKTYLQFALIPDEQWFSSNYAPYIAKENWTYSYFMDELAGAGDISHNITCELDFPTSIQGNIKGSLSLDLGAGSAKIKTISVKLHDQLMTSRTLPKAGMNNPALEQQMLTAANNLGWNDKFLKTIITSSAWVTEKNSLTGAILYRYVGAVCTTKSSDGKCYYQEFSFKQDYVGGGNYSSTVKYSSYGGKREIGCDKIK